MNDSFILCVIEWRHQTKQKTRASRKMKKTQASNRNSIEKIYIFLIFFRHHFIFLLLLLLLLLLAFLIFSSQNIEQFCCYCSWNFTTTTTTIDPGEIVKVFRRDFTVNSFCHWQTRTLIEFSLKRIRFFFKVSFWFCGFLCP